MDEEKDKKGELMKRLRLRYRLVVMNDETFEEKISLSLTPLKLFVLCGLFQLHFCKNYSVCSLFFNNVFFTPIFCAH